MNVNPSGRFPLDPELLDRYLAGQASADERALVERQMAERDALDELVHALESAELAGPVAEPVLDVEGDWARLTARMQAPIVAVAERPVVRVANRAGRRIRVWSAAAGLTAVAAGIAFLLVSPTLRAPGAHDATVQPTSSYATAVGQRQRITLAGGTIVELGPASQLRVFEDQRTVRLLGEAVFTVAHDPERPFVVQTARTTATVLGTEFTVRAYPTDAVARVAVVNGKVQVGKNVLSAGDVAQVGDGGVATVLRGQDVASYRSWVDGRIEFNDAPLKTVVEDLQRWYDIEVRVSSPSLLRDHITGTFGSNSLEYVIHALSIALDAKIEQDGRIITISRVR